MTTATETTSLVPTGTWTVDNTHSSASGLAAHRLIPGSQLHRLPIEDQDVPLIPFPDWAPYEDEIAQVLARFIARVSASARGAE